MSIKNLITNHLKKSFINTLNDDDNVIYRNMTSEQLSIVQLALSYGLQLGTTTDFKETELRGLIAFIATHIIDDPPYGDKERQKILTKAGSYDSFVRMANNILDELYNNKNKSLRSKKT